MSQQYGLETSVIKTAPPVRQLDPFPKSEPLDLAPLTQVQDISQKMSEFNQPSYVRDNYYGGYLSQPQSTIVSHPIQLGSYYPIEDSSQSLDLLSHFSSLPGQYGDPVVWQHTTYGTEPSAGYGTQSNASATSAPRAYADADVRGSSILYKGSVDMPSPVDSGIGAELSMITPKQEDGFYTGDGSLERPERSLSHRDSPVIIPKLHNTLGFQYVLEAPISTSIRKEDDRMTYVNKGQFYTVTLDYIPDAGKELKSHTVKSQMLVVFREDKTYEEEIKTWKCWHSRQHSAKQRILEVDAKNSSGFVHQINEIGHNCIEFYWNPADPTPVKISVAIQCLSTDFSNQKGVKGLPLHLQVDTFDGENETVPFHRGYCQVKVFCDKGANRKMLHENRRDEKRRMQGGNFACRKKSDGEYHESCDKSEFYHMRELDKPAAIFIAPEENEYRFVDPLGYDMDTMEPTSKRPRTTERIMLYIRKPTDTIFTPLHVVPPTLLGLAQSLCHKFGVDGDKVTAIYKRCLKGVTVKMDDDMLRLYSNEDLASVEIDTNEDGTYSIYLTEEREPNIHFAPQPSQ